MNASSIPDLLSQIVIAFFFLVRTMRTCFGIDFSSPLSAYSPMSQSLPLPTPSAAFFRPDRGLQLSQNHIELGDSPT